MAYSGEGVGLYIQGLDGEWYPAKCTTAGSLQVNAVVSVDTQSVAANVNQVYVTDTTTLLALVNTNRKGLVIQNGEPICYIKYGAGCTQTDYSYRLTKNMILEDVNYAGAITACLDTGISLIRITEKI